MIEICKMRLCMNFVATLQHARFVALFFLFHLVIVFHYRTKIYMDRTRSNSNSQTSQSRYCLNCEVKWSTYLSIQLTN